MSSLALVDTWSQNFTNLSAIIELVALQKFPKEILIFAICCAEVLSPQCGELLRKCQALLEKEETIYANCWYLFSHVMGENKHYS